MQKESDFVPRSLEAGYTDDMPQIIAGGVVMEKPTYKPLDLGRIKDKNSVLVSTEEALKDVTPIEWDEDVLNGNKRVVLVPKK